LAASSGIDEVFIYPQPVVSVVVTGSELASSGTPGPGQIRDSLSVQVTPWAQYLGASVSSSVRCADDLNELQEAIKNADVDLVIVTGGSSFGEHDYLRPALEQLGAIYVVSEIWMRPGHPTLLAKLPDGKLVAGLPGNPLAALVSFMTIVAPALRGLSGQSQNRMAKAQLAKEFACDRTRVVPIVLSSGTAELTEFRGSAMLRGLSHADGLGVISPGDNPAGTLIRILPLPWRVN
jgi:molybdopterin molybdotransferase